MKKATLSLLVACIAVMFASAQTAKTTAAKPATKSTSGKTTTAKPATKVSTGKTTTAKPAAKPAGQPKAASSNTQHLKKDGTPDKRYKENKPTSNTKSSAGATSKTTTGSKTASKAKPAAKPATSVKPLSTGSATPAGK